MKVYKIIGFTLSIILCLAAIIFQVASHTVIGFSVFAKDDVIIKLSGYIDTDSMLKDNDLNETELYYELVDIFDDTIDDINVINKVVYSESFSNFIRDIFTNEVSSILSNSNKEEINVIVDNNIDNILLEINPGYDIMERSIIRSSLIDSGNVISDVAFLEGKELIEIYKTLFGTLNINIVVVTVVIMLVVISILNLNIFKGFSFTGGATAIASLFAMFLSRFFGNFEIQDIEIYETFGPVLSEVSNILMKNGTQFLIVGLVMVGLSYIISRTREISQNRRRSL